MLTRPPLIVHLNDQSDCGTVDNAVVFHLDSIGSIPDLVHVLRSRGVWAVSTVGERHSPRFYHQDQNSTQWCGWVCLAARRHTCVYLVISDGAVFTKHRIISVSHHIRSDQIGPELRETGLKDVPFLANVDMSRWRKDRSTSDLLC